MSGQAGGRKCLVPKAVKLRRTGLVGIVSGAMVLLMCELPILLAFAGFAGMSKLALELKPTFVVEMAGIILIVVSIRVLIFTFYARRTNEQKGLQ